jgi:hypothetical protein
MPPGVLARLEALFCHGAAAAPPRPVGKGVPGEPQQETDTETFSNLE